MLKIHVEPDCGKAPKKELLRDFTIAFAKNNPTLILNALDENVVWEMVGDQLINGKSEAEKVLHTMLDGSTTELTLTHIITHGDEGAVSGTMKFGDETIFAFADVYKFNSHGKDAKIKQITSFVMEKK